MILKIRHETRYTLDIAATRAVQYLRLSPRNDRCQRLMNWHVSGPEILTPWTDGFGNKVFLASQNTDHEELLILVEGEIDTKDTVGVLPLDDGLPPGMFLRPTTLTAVTPQIEKFGNARAALREKEGDLAYLHALMADFDKKFEYTAGFTDATSTAAEMLKAKKGVCQDFAHLFIAACRTQNIPCRYVSGYIADGAGEPAMHAWAECHVAELGWVSFDPANQQSATESYIRLAIGYDYASAAPVTGLRMGGDGENLEVNVQVTQKQS